MPGDAPFSGKAFRANRAREARFLREQGRTVAQIAQQLGCSTPTVISDLAKVSDDDPGGDSVVRLHG